MEDGRKSDMESRQQQNACANIAPVSQFQNAAPLFQTASLPYYYYPTSMPFHIVNQPCYVFPVSPYPVQTNVPVLNDRPQAEPVKCTPTLSSKADIQAIAKVEKTPKCTIYTFYSDSGSSKKTRKATANFSLSADYDKLNDNKNAIFQDKKCTEVKCRLPIEVTSNKKMKKSGCTKLDENESNQTNYFLPTVPPKHLLQSRKKITNTLSNPYYFRPIKNSAESSIPSFHRKPKISLPYHSYLFRNPVQPDTSKDFSNKYAYHRSIPHVEPLTDPLGLGYFRRCEEEWSLKEQKRLKPNAPVESPVNEYSNNTKQLSEILDTVISPNSKKEISAPSSSRTACETTETTILNENATTSPKQYTSDKHQRKEIETLDNSHPMNENGSSNSSHVGCEIIDTTLSTSHAIACVTKQMNNINPQHEGTNTVSNSPQNEICPFSSSCVTGEQASSNSASEATTSVNEQFISADVSEDDDIQVIFICNKANPDKPLPKVNPYKPLPKANSEKPLPKANPERLKVISDESCDDCPSGGISSKMKHLNKMIRKVSRARLRQKNNSMTYKVKSSSCQTSKRIASVRARYTIPESPEHEIQIIETKIGNSATCREERRRVQETPSVKTSSNRHSNETKHRLTENISSTHSRNEIGAIASSLDITSDVISNPAPIAYPSVIPKQFISDNPDDDIQVIAVFTKKDNVSGDNLVNNKPDATNQMSQGYKKNFDCVNLDPKASNRKLLELQSIVGLFVPDSSHHLDESSVTEAVQNVIPVTAAAQSVTPDAARSISPVPDAARSVSPVPDAARSVSPVPDAARSVSPVPDAAMSASSVPDAARSVKHYNNESNIKLHENLPQSFQQHKIADCDVIGTAFETCELLTMVKSPNDKLSNLKGDHGCIFSEGSDAMVRSSHTEKELCSITSPNVSNCAILSSQSNTTFHNLFHEDNNIANQDKNYPQILISRDGIISSSEHLYSTLNNDEYTSLNSDSEELNREYDFREQSDEYFSPTRQYAKCSHEDTIDTANEVKKNSEILPIEDMIPSPEHYTQNILNDLSNQSNTFALAVTQSSINSQNIHAANMHTTNQVENVSLVQVTTDEKIQSSEYLHSVEYSSDLNCVNYGDEDSIRPLSSRNHFSDPLNEVNVESLRDSNSHTYDLPSPGLFEHLHSMKGLNLSSAPPCLSYQNQTSVYSRPLSRGLYKISKGSPVTQNEIIAETNTLSPGTCLVPGNLKYRIGYKPVKTKDVLLLILEWRTAWLLQEPKLYDPPTLSNGLKKVLGSYDCVLAYYNTIFPLMLLDTWHRIHVSWHELSHADPYYCGITSYNIKSNRVIVECQTVITAASHAKRMIPMEGNILVVKYGTKLNESGIKIFAYVIGRNTREFNPASDSKVHSYESRKNAICEKGDGYKVLTLRFMAAYDSEEIDKELPINIYVLCNVMTTLNQNDALLNMEKLPLLGSILNPEKHESVRLVSPPSRFASEKLNEYVQDIMKSVLYRHPLPSFTVVNDPNILNIIPLLICKIKASLQTNVLLCARTATKLGEVCEIMSRSDSSKFVIINKRWDTILKFRKYLLEELVKQKVNVAKEAEPYEINEAEVVNARKQIFKDCDVVLSLIRNCHHEYIENLFTQAFSVKNMCCIIYDASSCTEPQTLIPMLHGFQKVILIGDAKYPAKVLSQTADSLGYSRSLFHRALELNTTSIL